jgi:hypothetical protein
MKKPDDIRAFVASLAFDYGIVHMEQMHDMLDREQFGTNLSLAMDAQPTLVTLSNAGIPAFLANYVDPELIRVLTSPMKAAKVYGEVKKGNWVTLTTQFPMAESTGGTSVYGDFSDSGTSDSNLNWIPRQSFHFQTITQWGERQLDIAGEAQIDWAAQLNISSALTVNKQSNKIALFGVAGLQNFGAINDPALPTPIAPAATGTGSSPLWSNKTGDLVFADVLSLYDQLVLQGNGLVDEDTTMVLALSSSLAPNLNKTNLYNVNVRDQIRKNWENLRIETIPELNTTSGQLMQLFAETVENQKTVYTAFTEKMRAHPVKVGLSSFKQKKSAGHWGTVWRMPIFCAQMIGM